MVLITGALGFIGSCLISYFNRQGFRNIVVVDDFSQNHKFKNLAHKNILAKKERSQFPEWLREHGNKVSFVIHLGARTDTAEFDEALLNRLNLHYSREVWSACVQWNIPLIYASSAATYGLGEYGFEDSHAIVPDLKPLNPYGRSKNHFDQWVLSQQEQPPFWAGLKFFNVYGPNEYHKGRMASVIFHFFNQIQEHGAVKLFRSHRPDFKDGEQQRDFIYVKDVVRVIYQIYSNTQKLVNGLYNVGTGQARSFNDLVNSLFQELNQTPKITYIDTPLDIRDKYQYFTEADMSKWRQTGLAEPFAPLEEGIRDYVQRFLKEEKYY